MSRRPYIRVPSKTRWWLEQPRYVRYMMREISALFIGIYALALVAGLWQLSRGRAAYEGYLAAVAGPAGQVFSVLAMFFAIYHSYSWFQVTPKAMPLTFAGKPVPGAFIIAAHWIGFVLLSAALWLLVGSRA